MSQASLIAWRSAPMTPLAATSSSRIEGGPSRPAPSSASPTVRSSCSRASSRASGTLSKTVLMTRSRTSSSSKTSPKAPTRSSASGMNESSAK
jgi:hypothetical protein